MCVFYIGAIFYSRLLKKNLTVEIIPKEEQGWKTIRKWADIWRSANSVQQITKWRAYCKSCTTTVFISNDRESARLTTTARILATIVKYFEKNIHWTWGVKLNPLSLLFQLARYHRNNTNKRLQNNGFRTLQRNHMFSVALCIMRMRAWWLARVFCSYDPEPRVFFGFLWRQRS